MPGDAIFLSEDLFSTIISSDSTSHQSTPLVNYFFGKYFQVLRKEICSYAQNPVKDVILRSENTEFLQALYNLHRASNPQSGDEAFTAKILATHLSKIQTDFNLRGKVSDLNLSGPALLQCIEATEETQKLIKEHPQLENTALKTLISNPNDLKWKDTYLKLKAAYHAAFLEIRKLLQIGTVFTNLRDLEQTKDFLEEARNLIHRWSKKIKDLKSKLNTYPIETPQEYDLFRSLKQALRNIEHLDHFMKHPSINRYSINHAEIKDTLSFFEFQAIFILKAKQLLKGLAPKKDKTYYCQTYEEKAKIAINKLRLENIKVATEKQSYRSKDEVQSSPNNDNAESQEEKLLPKNLQQISAERALLHSKSRSALEQLNTSFLDYYQQLNVMIDQLAEIKRSKALVSYDDSSTSTIIVNLELADRARSVSAPLSARAQPEELGPKVNSPSRHSLSSADEHEASCHLIKPTGYHQRSSFVYMLHHQELSFLRSGSEEPEEQEINLPNVPLSP